MAIKKAIELLESERDIGKWDEIQKIRIENAILTLRDGRVDKHVLLIIDEIRNRCYWDWEASKSDTTIDGQIASSRIGHRRQILEALLERMKPLAVS